MYPEISGILTNQHYNMAPGVLIPCISIELTPVVLNVQDK